jgi:hypothetical protein
MVPSAKPAQQRGLSIIGFLLVAVAVVAAAMVAFRVIPAYVEYFAVQKALQDQLADASRDPQDIASFRRGIGARFNTGYVDSVSPADVMVTRENNNFVATAQWERRLHMVGNASILLEFTAVASR